MLDCSTTRLPGRSVTVLISVTNAWPSGLRLTEDSHRYRCIRGILAAPPVAFVRVAPLGALAGIGRVALGVATRPHAALLMHFGRCTATLIAESQMKSARICIALA